MSGTARLPRAAWTQRASLAKLVDVLGADDVRWVGGCVRDTMLGIAPHDIDCATTHRPGTAIDKCRAAGIRTVPTGIDHGTITAILEAEVDEIKAILNKDKEETGAKQDE